MKLVIEIKTIFAVSKGTYGSPRIHDELRAQGLKINKKKVARLMQLEGIRARIKGKFRIKPKTSKA